MMRVSAHVHVHVMGAHLDVYCMYNICLLNKRFFAARLTKSPHMEHRLDLANMAHVGKNVPTAN
jgi:hypothetical protein